MPELLQFDSIYWEILFYLFAGVTGIQLFYFWFFFSRIAFHKDKGIQQSSHPVSVVICARNEYDNIRDNLPLILKQDYPKFEVVLVNDGSDDDSGFLLADLSRQYAHLKVVNVQENVNFFKGKKFPLSVGIKSARYEHLLLTDADCKPISDQWLASMQSGFTDKKEIVLGYSGYEKRKGVLNKIIRLDTLLVALQYLSFAKAGLPYMGVGRNLAYTKALFHKMKGFSSHYKIASGDDDLFINKAGNNKNTSIVLNKESFTFSNPKTKFSAWWRQKRRHLTTGKYYKGKHKFLLGLYSFSQVMFFVLAIVLLVFLIEPAPVAGLIIIRLVSFLVIVKKTMNKLAEKNLLVISPLIEGLLLLTNFLVIISNLLVHQNKWK